MKATAQFLAQLRDEEVASRYEEGKLILFFFSSQKG